MGRIEELREDGRARVVLSDLAPAIDGGRHPIERVVGESVQVGVDAFVDGHDRVALRLQYRREGEAWHEAPMVPAENDRWRGAFTVTTVGRWQYTVVGWVDRFETWRHDLRKRVAAGQDVRVDLTIGAALVEEAVGSAPSDDAARLRDVATALAGDRTVEERVAVALDADLVARMARSAPRRFPTRWPEVLDVTVDPIRARFSAWYEMFPRSAGPDGRHGTLADVERCLSYVAGMGFDVLYLPPIHPIGRTYRKGRNNTLEAMPGDPGSPWAIGAKEGGHKAVHPDLGTIDDLRHLAEAAREHGLELALDVALQCAPDHPYVKQHPEWFKHRPDGRIQYAENPPKKYQDIYPFDFECAAWRELWAELLSIFTFWIDQGVRIFRVDNPHTKSFRFWAWCIAEIKREHPDVILLSEAFTRPKVMYDLAKRGFTQSYTYFAWKNTKHELEDYFTAINRPPVREFFRPNAWPNTPDILTDALAHGGRAVHAQRAVLASTLCASWGIYGPPFELFEAVQREGSEEYVDNEKYQLRTWDRSRPDSLAPLITRLNRVRREHPALQQDWTLRFHETDDERLICYSKTDETSNDVVVVVVGLDPHHPVTGHVTLDLDALGIAPDATFQVHDRLTDARFLWTGPRNYVEVDPSVPAHVFAVRRRLRTERDFEYFL